MLNIQELANFITEKLNIISADNGASYVFDIYAEIGHNENDGHIKGTIISKSNNPLVVKSLASAKIIYVVELAIPNGMANKKLIEIQNIIGEFVKTYEGTEQDFETGKASFELTYAHLPENYSIKNETGGIVPLQFEITVNYTDNGLLGSSKVWLLNGAEIPYVNEVILLNKEGQTNRISREKYNKTIVLAQTKFYRFTIPFDTTNTVCTTLQADMLNGDFDKTYTLSYYDGTTYTAQNPFTTTVSIYQSGDSKSDGGAISMFDITFADVSAVEVAPKYTLELFSTPFDEQNERWFDSVEEQTEWYDDLDVKTPAVQIKAPNLNTISNTTQVYDFNGIANFPYTETEVANMNVARINEQTTKPKLIPYTILETSYKLHSGWILEEGNQVATYTNVMSDTRHAITLNGSTYYLEFKGLSDDPHIYDGLDNEIEIVGKYFMINDIEYQFSHMTSTRYRNGYIKQNGVTVTQMESDVPYHDWTFQIDGKNYYANRNDEIIESFSIVQVTLPTPDATTYISNSGRVYLLAIGENSYEEYITIRTGRENNYTYSWKKVGEIQGDLSNFEYEYISFDISGNGLLLEDVANGSEFTIIDGNIVNRYYYTIQSAEIGANKQVILTLRLNTFQTYVINPQLQFSECFINKAHLDRFIDNNDGVTYYIDYGYVYDINLDVVATLDVQNKFRLNGVQYFTDYNAIYTADGLTKVTNIQDGMFKLYGTVSFNGGLESPLFEREEVKNVAKRMVARQVLKYDFGDYSNETDPVVIARKKRVEEWLQSNIQGWLYAYLPRGHIGVYPFVSAPVPAMIDVDYNTNKYHNFGGGNIDSNFVVFVCPVYKSSKKIIIQKTMTYENTSGSILIQLKIETGEFMSYLQTRTNSSTQSIPYSVKFSTKPPMTNFSTFLSGFDVDAYGDLVSIEAQTSAIASTQSFNCGNFRAVCINFVNGDNPLFYGSFVVTSPLLPTLDMEDYIIINPITFPKSNSSYIDKTFYKINRPYIKTTVPQSFTLFRPLNTTHISITICIVETPTSSRTGTYQVENLVGSYNLEGGAYRLTIKDASMTFEILQLPNNFSYFDYITFNERVYGIMGADKNPMYNPKLLSSDYRALKLTNERGAEFEYDIQKLNQETIKTAVTEQITADLQKSYFRIMDTDGVYQEKCEENLTGLVDSAETSIPLATDPWKKTLAEQPNFFKQMENRRLSNIGVSLVGGAVGGVISGQGLKGAATGLVLGAAKAWLDIVNEDLTIDNMNKQPYSIQNAGGNVVFNLSYTEVGMTIEQHALLPQEERIINDQMFANGYTYNRIDQLRNFTHTRKYFNTLVANIETMSGLPLSNEVREDIKQRFANGVRLWHDDTIQYEKENYELWLEEE